MKLYATVTSERASKGQGGKYVEISVKDESGNETLALAIHNQDNLNMPMVTHFWAGAINIDKIFELKGNKQKGDTLERPSYETLLEFYSENSPSND